MKKDLLLDNLDSSSDDIYQEEKGEELFDGTLYSASKPTGLRRGFYEDLEDKVDMILSRDAEEEAFEDLLLSSFDEEDPYGR